MSEISKSTNTLQVSEKNLKWQSLLLDQQNKHQSRKSVGLTPRVLHESDPLPPSNRLIAIIPDSDFNIFELTKQIWDLAEPDGWKVLLITKPIRHENTYHSRLTLITLANLIRNSRVTVEKQLVADEEPLIQAILKVSQPDDVIVCFEEHRIPGFLRNIRLVNMLAKKTSLPIHTLKGSISEMTNALSDRFVDIFLLVISLVSIIGFFALQVWFDRNTIGLFHMILQILSTFVEILFVGICANRSFRL